MYLRIAAGISFRSFMNSGCSIVREPTNICNRESSAGRYAALGRIVARVFQAADSATLRSLVGYKTQGPEYEDDEKIVRSREALVSSTDCA